jgi:4-hydroxy-3-methylbut-2-enyl diphosphate reductase
MGINRAYSGMNNRALAEAPFTVVHQNSANEFDTLRRIVGRDPELLNRYPGLDRVAVSFDPGNLHEGDRLVLGFHGLPNEDKHDLTAKGVDLLEDLICPFIAKLDRVVERHVSAGFDVAMVGSADNHHLRTARKFAAAHGRRCFAIVKADDIDVLPFADGVPIVLVGEVTGNTEVFHEAIARIETLKLPLKVMKTMCADSYSRQREAVELAQNTDVVVLVDDGGDGARSVFEVCSRVNGQVHRVRDKRDIQSAWLAGASKVAVVGGILIPDWTINEVAQHIRAMHDDLASSKLIGTQQVDMT